MIDDQDHDPKPICRHPLDFTVTITLICSFLIVLTIVSLVLCLKENTYYAIYTWKRPGIPGAGLPAARPNISYLLRFRATAKLYITTL